MNPEATFKLLLQCTRCREERDRMTEIDPVMVLMKIYLLLQTTTDSFDSNDRVECNVSLSCKSCRSIQHIGIKDTFLRKL